MKIKKFKKENYLLNESIKAIQKRKCCISYIDYVLHNIEIFNREELIQIIKNIKIKME